jgi:hypothetical protein
VRALAATAGMMGGVEAGELLAAHRIPCTADPLRMLAP